MTINITTLDGRAVELTTLRCDLSSRGGGFEVNLCNAGWPGVGMTAYQNYLGGGLLGRIMNSCTIRDWQDSPELSHIAKELRTVLHSVTNPDPEDQPWESQTLEQNGRMPVSGY